MELRAAVQCLQVLNQSNLGVSKMVAKGTETRSPALGNIIGAELKWLDPH